MRDVTENQVAHQICDLLRLHGWRVHRLEADLYGPRARAKREECGTPDYIAVRPKYDGFYDVVYVEVKRPGARLRKTQEIWISDARKRGWKVVVASRFEDLVDAGLIAAKWRGANAKRQAAVVSAVSV
jgi:hypothetical protein